MYHKMTLREAAMNFTAVSQISICVGPTLYMYTILFWFCEKKKVIRFSDFVSFPHTGNPDKTNNCVYRTSMVSRKVSDRLYHI